MIENIQNSLVNTIQASASKKSAAKGFADSLKQAFEAVNNQILNADKKIENLATGRDKDIHGTMIALEKANISMKLLMAVRGKIVSSYEEIMRMQV